ncbi:unnamed protein product [Allacma fusca]|uniref:Protein kinase domain-containing protein n=1 Tax=Allacma fusca TaxID=39272 RepID=A0A8J2LC58_9HEXA|nr:unnamed protein product [Allacma fusca]
MERLGYGTGVGVYLMERSPRISGEMRSPWAIKKISKLRDTKKTYVVRLEHEAKILKQLNHPNIIGFRGFGKPGSDAAYLAMEKASGCLGDLIEKRFDEFVNNCETEIIPASDPFPAEKILKVAEDVAKALTYLHDEVKMIHGDMKSANVLVFGDFETIKLCDFGVSRKIREDGTIEGDYVGTEIWSPLEIARKQRSLPHEPITAKVDIYPYGLTLFEMISLKPPHLPTVEDAYGSDETFDEETFEDTLAECIGTRPMLPDIEFDSSYHKILALFFCCTEESPLQRPDARDILKVFTEDELVTACSKVTI